MTSQSNHLFCFGMGYCAKAFASRLGADEWHISGSTRSENVPNQAFDHHFFDGNAPLAKAPSVLEDVTHILVSAAPGATGDPVLAHHRDDISQLKALKWVGYLSTTGVYGDTGGMTVNEAAATHPSSKRSQNRLAAETEWLDLFTQLDVPVHIFRLPGIYGPGRSALDQVSAGKARRIDKPGHMFSRVHVDDIANTLATSVDNCWPGRIYNVCDDEAAAPADVTAYACELLGIDPPEPIPFETAQQTMSPMALSFWQDNRRVDNTRLKSELGVKLEYPTYRQGLRAIYETKSG